MSARCVVASPVARDRIQRAAAWLGAHARHAQLLIVAPTLDAAGEPARAALAAAAPGTPRAAFGWHRTTLARLAASIAGPRLAERRLAPASRLALEALAARVVFRLRGDGGADPALGRFAPVGDRPGLPRALHATFDELRHAAISPAALASHASATRRDLARLLAAYEKDMADAGLADRPATILLALERLAAERAPPAPVGLPILLTDVAVRSPLERDLIAALVARAPSALATVVSGDGRSRAHLEAAFGMAAVEIDAAVQEDPEGAALRSVQRGLFADAPAPPAPASGAVLVLSAPGESREAVEIARIVHREAERGIRFDRMAVLLRAPLHYRIHLEEAFRRAAVPAHFDRGTRRPDPAGRALLALLACAAEGLSARRFAEYLSLGQVPDSTTPDQRPAGQTPPPRWVPPDEETLPGAITAQQELEELTAREEDPEGSPIPADPEAAPSVGGTLRAPRRWEQLLVDAAVIGGRDRWRRRLRGLAEELRLDLEASEEDADRERFRARMQSLQSLETFAMPLLDVLDALPRRATWGAWLDALAVLAAAALRNPERVLSVLAELSPMAAVGPVDLAEVRLVLQERLADLVARPVGRRAGRVLVAPIEAARGLTFDLVLVPGLAERMFPQKVNQDPILRDADREGSGLATNDDRVAEERLALHLAVGAATKRLILSYPRVDMDQSRPRVPSFYGLEVMRAYEGRLPSFDDLARGAERAVEGATRIGWPAPQRPADAIDEAEHDLALLADLFLKPEAETVGTARYLLGVNPHLARALRFRARRWIRAWKAPDGLVDPIPEARAALARHALSARSFSPTSLQHYAACPYRFFLQAIHRLAPREVPASIDELDPLQRGSLVHQVQFELLGALRDEGLLPVTTANLERAQARLDDVLARVARDAYELLAPAIDRVWQDGIASIKADLREWLRRAAADPVWIPWRFELSFGLKERRAADPSSRAEAVQLASGLLLRGSIDLVERSQDGALRATDYKTGRVRAKEGGVIGGGETLQPVLYALALEKLFETMPVEAGRLYYCTTVGGFTEVKIPLDAAARESAAEVAGAVSEALDQGFLPAAPRAGACQYCDYLRVCGPYEELRSSRYKKQEPLTRLKKLRSMP